MNEIIKCENLSYGYKDIALVDDLSFNVNEGDLLAIVGENGAGKSSLLKVLLKTLKPKSGNIQYVNFKQNQIGYLPQITELQKDFPATVWEIVLSGRSQLMGLRPFFTANDKKIAKEKIALLHIENLVKKRFKSLSGGQRQKVLLARALCGTEKLLILDEPVTGLDQESTKEMHNIIQELHNQGLTIIVISHDIDYVKATATHVLYIGKETFFGTVEEFARRNND